MHEYVCIWECFWNNCLVKEGQIVMAEDKEMKGNPCFEVFAMEEPKADKAQPKKVVKKEEAPVLATHSTKVVEEDK